MDNQEPSPGPVIPIMVSKGALADPGSHAAVAASAPALRMAHACPCAQLHVATVTWPLQAPCTQSHIHTQYSLPGVLQSPALSWAWCSWAHMHEHALAYTQHSHPALHICTCAYELYYGHTEVRTDAYSVHSCSPLAPPVTGKQLPQGALSEHFPRLRLCS